MHQLDRAPKGLLRTQTIANSVCTSRRSHVHKQLPILYVRRDAPTYTTNCQFCMYVETLPRTQTIGNSVCTLRRLPRACGRALALPEAQAPWPQVSIVRARAPGDGPHPRLALDGTAFRRNMRTARAPAELVGSASLHPWGRPSTPAGHPGTGMCV